MTDASARRVAEGAADGPIAIEVPLTGPGGAEAEVGAAARPIGRPPPSPSWRAVAIGAAMAGTAIGIGAVVLSGSGDDGDDPDDTGSAPVIAGAEITTPPTLRPLDTLPVPDDPQLERVVPTGPEATSSQDRSLFDGVTRPVYPAVTDVGLGELVQYDIAGAVAMLGDDIPRRSTTHIELGTAGFVLDVTIERDTVRDRYRITFESDDDVQTAVVDIATDTTYIRTGDGRSVDVLNADIISGSGAADANEYFDRLLLGPVRPDTFVAAATRGRGLVTIDDVRIARQFISNIQGVAIPEWQLYVFSPVFEFPVEDRPSLLEYAVYVDDAGRIVQVDGLSLVGDVPQLIEHRLEEPAEPIVVEIPPPAITAPVPATTGPPPPSSTAGATPTGPTTTPATTPTSTPTT